MDLRHTHKLDLTPLITHTFPFERAAKAYELLDEHAEKAGPVVLSFPEALRQEPHGESEARTEAVAVAAAG